MDKRKIIDKIIYSYKYDEIDELWELAGMEMAYSKRNLEKYSEELSRRITAIVEENDFEYFLTKNKGDEKDIDVFFYILMHSSKTESIKACLKDIKYYPSVRYDDIIELIMATKDPEYIRNAIENYQNFGIAYNSATVLIRRTKDVELAKKQLEKAEEQIKTQSEETQTIWDDWSFDIDLSQSYISGKAIANLAATVNDRNVMLYYIENAIKYSLLEDDIAFLIRKINDPEITEQYLNNDEFEFSKYNIIKMIKATKDKDFIGKYIKNEEMQFSIDEKIDLLSAVSDNEWIENYIRGTESGFSSEDILKFLNETGNLELVKQYMIKRDEFGFSKEQIFGLIQGLNDKELTLECISEYEKYGLASEDANRLRVIYDGVYRNQILQGVEISEKINLPPEMTIGVEIECVGKMSPFLQAEGKKFFDGWKVKSDASVKSQRENELGIEIVSPILTGENDLTTQSVEKVTTILNQLGHYSNETCGGHIHIGANYLTSVEAWQNLVELYANTEMILYAISNQEGNVPRRDVVKYAMPISNDLEEAMKSGSVNLENEEDIEGFKRNLVTFQNDNRYKGINFMNLKSGGRNTIEFRLANGTVDPKVWIENINLFGGMIRAAQEMAVIQQKNPEDRTQNENKMLECFEQLRSGTLSEEQKLEDLLEIVIQEKERDSYRKRYYRNIELLEKEPEIGDALRQKTENSGVKISKKEIAREIFFSDESVTMGELNEISELINRSLNHQVDVTERGE